LLWFLTRVWRDHTRERWHSRCRGKGLYTSLTRADTTEGKPSIISAVNEMCQRWRMYVTRGVRLADAADYPARKKSRKSGGEASTKWELIFNRINESSLATPSLYQRHTHIEEQGGRRLMRRMGAASCGEQTESEREIGGRKRHWNKPPPASFHLAPSATPNENTEGQWKY